MELRKIKEEFRNKVFTPSATDIKNSSYGFSVFQANINKFLPDINSENYACLYKQLIFNQYLVGFDQNDFEKLEKATILNKSCLQLLPNTLSSTIFATFHYGSYRVINSYLLKQGFKVVLIIDEHAYNNQKDKYEESYKNLKKYATKNDSDYIVLNVKDPSSIFKLKELLKKGYVLIVYLDGNTGVQKEKNFEKGFSKINFLDSKINVKNGISVLSWLLNAKIIPVITNWDKNENLNIKFYNTIYPTDYSDRKLFVEQSISNLYSILEKVVIKEPQQWECWSYIHEWFERDKISPYILQDINTIKWVLNQNRYSLFSIKDEYYFFDKHSYRAFPIDYDTFTKIESKSFIEIKNNNLQFLLSKNVII